MVMALRILKNLLTSSALGAALSLVHGQAGAELPLNFSGQTGTYLDAPGSISYPIANETHGSTANNVRSQTPFIYERVTDSQNNQAYYHMVLGCSTAGVCDPGFAQEVYIQIGTTQISTLSISGIGTQNSASLGAGCDTSAGCGSKGGPLASGGGNLCTLPPCGNAGDPLGVSSEVIANYFPNTQIYTGNSTANPNRVEMHQVMNSGELTTDFLKGKYAEKPTITNNITATDFSSTFKIDNTGNTYNSITPAQVTNQTQVLDHTTGNPIGSFDTVTGSQQGHVTAGNYTYTPGTGNPFCGGTVSCGANGTYTYYSPNGTQVEGSANLNPDWKAYFDHSLTNPWAYTTYRP
jgi:hypothetical protein